MASDEYQKKVREIAVKQWRCKTGADLVTEKPKDEPAQIHKEHAKAA